MARRSRDRPNWRAPRAPQWRSSNCGCASGFFKNLSKKVARIGPALDPVSPERSALQIAGSRVTQDKKLSPSLLRREVATVPGMASSLKIVMVHGAAEGIPDIVGLALHQSLMGGL
jgi:hypothetical protein